MLSPAGSAAVLFNGIKGSWRLARKILFLVLTVIREILTLLAILHLEIAKKLFAAGSGEQLNSPQKALVGFPLTPKMHGLSCRCVKNAVLELLTTVCGAKELDDCDSLFTIC